MGCMYWLNDNGGAMTPDEKQSKQIGGIKTVLKMLCRENRQLRKENASIHRESEIIEREIKRLNTAANLLAVIVWAILIALVGIVYTWRGNV